MGGSHFPASAITSVQIMCHSLLFPHIHCYFDRGADQEILSPKNALQGNPLLGMESTRIPIYFPLEGYLPLPSFVFWSFFNTAVSPHIHAQRLWDKKAERKTRSQREAKAQSIGGCWQLSQTLFTDNTYVLIFTDPSDVCK